MENDTIHIAVALDDNFIKPASVMLVSLFETNKTNTFYLHLFSANLKEENINFIGAIAKKNKTGFKFYHIDKKLFEHYKTNQRISFATYYRILIPQIIDSGISKIIYLDGDIIINGNIKPLWDTEIDSFIIAAVNDPAAVDMKDYLRLNIPKEYHYFNSGVLLMNIKEWNSADATNRVMEFLNNHMDICKFLDQDGLNATLFNSCKRISPLWNLQVGVYYCDSDIIHTVYPDDDMELVKANPAIIHFNGTEKPWHYVSLHPLAKKYKYYSKLSGIDDYNQNVTFKTLIKKELYRFIGWENWNRHAYNDYKKTLLEV